MAHPAALLDPFKNKAIFEAYKQSYFYNKPYLLLGVLVVWMVVFGMFFVWLRRNRR